MRKKGKRTTRSHAYIHIYTHVHAHTEKDGKKERNEEKKRMKGRKKERKKETCNKVQSKFLLNNDVGCIAKRMPRLFSAACVCMVARKERQYYSPVDPSV